MVIKLPASFFHFTFYARKLRLISLEAPINQRVSTYLADRGTDLGPRSSGAAGLYLASGVASDWSWLVVLVLPSMGCEPQEGLEMKIPLGNRRIAVIQPDELRRRLWGSTR